jgi:hypothetical protein
MHQLTLEKARELLNAHLDDTVTVRLSRSPDERPMLNMEGTLGHVAAELLPHITGATPTDSEELGTLYWLDGPGRLIDLAQLRTLPAPITGSDAIGIVIDLGGGVTLSLLWHPDDAAPPPKPIQFKRRTD